MTEKSEKYVDELNEEDKEAIKMVEGNLDTLERELKEYREDFECFKDGQMTVGDIDSQFEDTEMLSRI